MLAAPPPSALFTAAVLLLSACASSHSQQLANPRPAYSRDMEFSADALSGSRTAWDVIVRRAPMLLSQGNGGSNRGVTTSLAVGGPPLLVLDGTRTRDLGQLRNVPTDIIASIRILNDADGGIYYGPDGAHGVIVVNTRQ